jgi:hypothetical protein
MLLAHANNVLRDLSTVADDVEAASFSVEMPSRAKALFTRAMGRKRLSASSRGACYAFSALRGSVLCSLMLHLLDLCII